MVTDRKSITRYLAKIGEPTDVPARSPSRGPPYWQSTVLAAADGRRRAVAERENRAASAWGRGRHRRYGRDARLRARGRLSRVRRSGPHCPRADHEEPFAKGHPRVKITADG